jgi:hypothetical protein
MMFSKKVSGLKVAMGWTLAFMLTTAQEKTSTVNGNEAYKSGSTDFAGAVR